MRLCWCIVGCLLCCDVVATASVPSSLTRFLDVVSSVTDASDYSDQGPGDPRGSLWHAFTLPAGANHTVWVTHATGGVDLSTAPPFGLQSTGARVGIVFQFPTYRGSTTGGDVYMLKGAVITTGGPVHTYFHCNTVIPSAYAQFNYALQPTADGNRLIVMCEPGPANCTVRYTAFLGSVPLCAYVVEGALDALAPFWLLIGRALLEVLLVLIWRCTWRSCCRERRVHAYEAAEADSKATPNPTATAVTIAATPRLPPGSATGMSFRTRRRGGVAPMEVPMIRGVPLGLQLPELGRTLLWVRLLAQGAVAVWLATGSFSHWQGWTGYGVYALVLTRGTIISTTLWPPVLRLVHQVISPGMVRDPVQSEYMARYDRREIALFVVPAALTAPFVCTHYLPMLLTYLWYLVFGGCACAAVGAVGYGIVKFAQRGMNAYERGYEQDRMAAAMVCSALLLSMPVVVSYGCLFYTGLNYGHAVSIDWEYRTSLQYFLQGPEAFASDTGQWTQATLLQRLLSFA